MMQAALANGTCGHADETDDTHPPTRSHPGCSVVPATLALCEHFELSGTAMLRAMVLGYDLCARLLLALDNIHLLKTGHHAGSKGGLENPLTRQDAEEKTMDLVAPVLGRARGRKLIATLFEAQKLKSLRALRSLYSA